MLMQTSYTNILKQHKLAYSTKAHWLLVGGTEGPLFFYISACVAKAVALFEIVLPVLKQYAAGFRIIKDAFTHYQLNGGFFGSEYIGKVVTVWPETKTQTTMLINALAPLLASFTGPSVLENCYRVSTVLFVPVSQKSSLTAKVPLVCYPEKFLAVGLYVPVKMLKYSPKGNVYKGHSLRRLRFEPCLIKEGRPYMAEDFAGRDVRDRLLWEKSVLEALAGLLPVPRVLGYLPKNGNSYLIVEFLEGRSIEDMMQQAGKKESLALLTSAVALVLQLHAAGYVHRDLNGDNFMTDAAGKLYLIDFEIAYCVADEQPSPAFYYGMPGYAAPEQQQHVTPTVAEDVYSLGMLVLVAFTKISAQDLQAKPLKHLEGLLTRHVKNAAAVQTITRCLHVNPIKRPLLTELAQTLNSLVV